MEPNKDQEKMLDNLFREHQKDIDTKPVGRERYATDSTAEDVVSAIATIILIGGIVGCIGCIIGGINSSNGYGGETAMVTFTIIGIVVLVIAIIQWAFLRVLCNISRNLFNIKDILQDMRKKEEE